MIYQLLETSYVMNRVPNLDEYLEMVGLWRKLVPRDGRCLFRSIGEQLFGTQTVADDLLNRCALHLEKHSPKFLRHLSHPVDQYLTSVRKAQTCAAHPHLDVFLEIVSSVYDCMVVVYHQLSTQPTCICTKPKHTRTIELCKIGKHYDTVMSRDRVTAYAQCQSLLFDLLYSKVFQMPDDEIDFGVSALRHKVNKRKDSVGEGLFLESGDDSGHGGESNELSPNKMPFSYRAAKGLDNNIFRNIAFDIWREENLDRATGDQLLIPGNQCIVQLPDSLESDGVIDSEAIIQEYDDENQIVSAFVQSLGMRVEVPREAVKSISDRNANGVAVEAAKSSNKRRYGVKQDVHWHNRPETHQKHYLSTNVMYWPGASGGGPGIGGPVCTSAMDSAPPQQSGAPSQHVGPRRFRERGMSDGGSQGQLTVQVSPSAFAAAAHQAGYPVAQVPSLMSASPTRGEHPGGPQGSMKPLAKVYFNSIGKPAVCKLQLPRYMNHKKHSLSEGSQELSSGDAAGSRETCGRSSTGARVRSSSQSAAVGAAPDACGPVAEAAAVLSPIVSSIRPAGHPPLMPFPMGPPGPGQQQQQAAEGPPVVGGVQLLPYVHVPFVHNLPGPVDTAADFSKDAMGRDLPQADTATMRYFFNLGVQYFRIIVAQTSPLPVGPQPAPWLQFSQGSVNSPAQRSSPAAGQSVRVVPLMDIEHSQQQQQPVPAGGPPPPPPPPPPHHHPQQQPHGPQQPQQQAPMSGPPVASPGGMMFAPGGLFPGAAQPPPPPPPTAAMYLGGHPYYPVGPGGACVGLDGGPLLGPGGGTMPPDPGALQAPPGMTPGLGVPGPSWAYCYI